MHRKTTKKIKVYTDKPCHTCGMVTGTKKIKVQTLFKPATIQYLCTDHE